jgi:beta-glucosidase
MRFLPSLHGLIYKILHPSLIIFAFYPAQITPAQMTHPIQSNQNPPTLPQDFRFCVATSAHQIEGKNYNSDWWEWEQRPGTILNGDTSERATDSWNFVDQDIANLKKLGVQDYRFSIEWAKVVPEPGQIDPEALHRYVSLIKKLVAARIHPMITFYHFTLPLWVSNHGGWDQKSIATDFEFFVIQTLKFLKSELSSSEIQFIPYWVTLNEPMTVIAAGYISSVFPPGKNDFRSIALPMTHMIQAHAKAYHAIHQELDQPQYKPSVGLAHHLRPFDPVRSFNVLDRALAKKFDEVFNWAIPDALKTGVFRFKIPFILSANASIPEAKGTQDFFGVNYYSRDRVAVKLFSKEKLVRTVTVGSEVTDLPWEIYPLGIKRILRDASLRYPGLPIYITENGLADRHDQKRIRYIRDHLNEISEALAEGIPVKGYCHWTLNDNFEWAEGYSAKFGLFSLEPNTLNRIPRKSALDFAELVFQTRNSGLIKK